MGRQTRILALAALAFGVIALLATITLVAGGVRAQLRDLAADGHAAWHLAQLEGEFLAFERAVNADARDIAQVQRRFDAFDARLTRIESQPVFDPEFVEPLRAVVAFRDHASARLAAGDGAALGPLSGDSAGVARHIRDLARFGVTSAQSDNQALSERLSRLAALIAVLVAVLTTACASFAALALQARSRAREAQKATSRLKAVSETSLEAILVCTDHGQILEANSAAETAFGTQADAVIGQNVHDLLALDGAGADAGAWSPAAEAASGPNGRRAEARRANGETFPIELAIRQTDTPEGPVFLCFIRDISDRIAYEHALQAARDEALAGEKAKADVLAVMSHEMRTPLNGILGTLELLGRTELDPEQRDHIEIMSKSGELLLHHINDVLELSRLDSGQAILVEDVFDLPEMLDDVAGGLQHLAHAAQTEIEVVLHRDGLDHVRGAPRRMRQVLVNLAGNAVKFTENGKVTITARRMPGSDDVEISIADTGIGIAAEDQARIFEQFVTIDPKYNRRSEGTGLGLAITRKLVDAMGGTIAVHSAPGQGSTFTVTMPLPPVQIGRRAMDVAVAPQAAPSFPGLHVLLVEDNPINRRIAHAMLDGLKCTIVEAENGACGVEAAREHKFDAILMDISMPEMDGIEATRQIRAGPSASTAANIVALTAHAMQEDVARFRAAGMNDVVVKPVSTDRLAAALDRRRTPLVQSDPQVPVSCWDAAVFDEFLQVLGPSDTQDMLAHFLRDAREVVPWLVWQASEDLERAEVASRAHGLAGSAAVLGATELHAALRALEEAARKDRPLASKGTALAKVWAATEASIPDVGGAANSAA